MNFQIRSMQADDALQVAPLILEAIEDLAHKFTGTTSDSEAIAALAELIKLPHNRFSYEYGIVICQKNEILAMAIAYPASIMQQLSENTVALANEIGKKLGTRAIDPKMAINLIKGEEAPAHTYYVDNLAVRNDYRGLGLASELLKAMSDRARQLTFKELTLLADVHNERAYKLYKRLGFVDQVHGDLPCLYQVHGHQYYGLVKFL